MSALAEANGGCLFMSSTVGVGTCVFVRLPQRETSAEDPRIAACRAARAVDLSKTCATGEMVAQPVKLPTLAS